MGLKQVSISAAPIVVVLGVAVAAIGCGAVEDDRPSFSQDQTTSSYTDPSPGETSISAVDGAEEDGVGHGNEPPSAGDNSAAVGSNDGRSDNETPGSTIVLGSSVLVDKGFVHVAGRKVGVIASTASVGPEGHIVDVLHAAPNTEVVAVFSPEHGFRSDQPAGAAVVDGVDPSTGIPIFSLYGESYKPTSEMLEGIEVLVYDLQDVGTRYYTYISTLGLAMQAAAEAGIDVVVLDRPDPSGGRRISGPVAPPEVDSFISQYPIPAVYGMTVGELANAIVGESWLDGLETLDLTVVPMQGWNRDQRWTDTGLPWTPPSPGLPTPESALSYPSVVLFEATTVSFGQGTDRPFTQVGAPWLDAQRLATELTDAISAAGVTDVRFLATSFTPQPTPSAPNPRFSGETVPGVRVEISGPDVEPSLVALHLLAAVQRQSPSSIIDRPSMFDLLAGSKSIRQQLIDGVEPEAIVESWAAELERFDRLRNPYLLYQ